MTSRSANFLSGATVDRASHLRRDAGWLAGALGDPRTRVLPLKEGQTLIRRGDEPQPLLFGVRDLDRSAFDFHQSVFLGLEGDVPVFALDVSAPRERELESTIAGAGEFVDFREIGSLLPQHEGALIAYARGLLEWHRRHRFCANCGHPTDPIEGGHVRACSACSAQHYPRTDPAVIMLVTLGDRCLLGRQASWPERLFSTLAGFVEPGESLEEAVRREVFEEAGIEISEARYHSSQPWPFPASLMIGFNAIARTTEFHFRDGELADARWLTRDELRHEKESGLIRLSRPLSIARRLIEEWLAA